MTKYCKNCGEKKGNHNFYIVQGEMFMHCEKTNCGEEYNPDDFKKKNKSPSGKD